MKITGIETFVVDAGWRPWQFVAVRTDEGITGYGECSEPRMPYSVVDTAQEFGTILIGKDPREVIARYWDMHRIARQSPGGIAAKAMAGIELAFWDIKGKALGVPVYELFGGPVRDRQRVYWSHCGSSRLADHELIGVPALETLDHARKDRRRQFRIGLPGIEDLLPLKANHTGKGFGPEVPDSIHPVVRTHDETGELTLYVNPEFTTHLVDVPEADNQRMLWPLWMHQTCMEFMYRHAWRAGDLVVWDNRYVLHTAIQDDDESRYMIRCTVKGPRPS